MNVMPVAGRAESRRRNALGTAAIALLALASSAMGIVNEFPYDDRYIIDLNPATHDLHRWWNVFATSYWPRSWGGDGYRPLTMLAFKLEWVIGHGRPAVFHAANILLYAGVAVLVYGLARRLLPAWAAWTAAALFAVHPVHVEAVAGIVGQSELLVACALLAALLLYVRDRSHGELRQRTAIQIVVLYAVACFSKEHGIVLPAVLVAAELIILRPAGPALARREELTDLGRRARRLRPFYLVLALIAVAFVAIRAHVLADHGIGGFQPFTPFNTLHITTRDRILTALGVVPHWIRLFYWPVRLSSEYGPPDIQIAQGPGLWQLPGLLLLCATLTLAVVLRRRRPAISFGIVLGCIALLPSSNFLVPAGIVLAERTLFLPSVGAMIAGAGVLAAVADEMRRRNRLTPAWSRGAAAGCTVVLLAGVVRSAERTKVWHDNETLFTQAVIDSPFAYRAHYMLGAWDFEKKRKRLGEAEYKKALALFPYDAALSYNLAEQYRQSGLCGPALPLYEWSQTLDPHFPMGHGAYATCLLNEGRFDDAKARALDAIRFGANVREMRRVIFLSDSVKSADNLNRISAPPRLAGSPSKSPESVQKAAKKV